MSWSADKHFVVLKLSKTPNISPSSLKTLKNIASGAAPLPQDIRDTMKTRFDVIVTDGKSFQPLVPTPGSLRHSYLYISILEHRLTFYFVGYGCTECSPIISAQAPPHALAGKMGVGPIAPGISVKIVPISRPTMATSPSIAVPGVDVEERTKEEFQADVEEGEIRVKGPNVFAGYLAPSTPSTSAANLNQGVFDEEGYYRTGDLGIVDKDGHLVVTGREKDLVKYNGFQVSVSELEGASLLPHCPLFQ